MIVAGRAIASELASAWLIDPLTVLLSTAL